MKLLLIISALMAIATAAPSEELDILDKYDFDALFANEEQRKTVFDCMLDVTPCGEMQKFKDSVITVIQNQCEDCTPEQKEKFDQVLKTLQEKFETVFIELMKKLDTKKE